MKDTEFIELLNLYLDAEISPADASRLEAEVQRNPQRYRIYQQYCRMQKACTMLAADFTTDAPTVVALKAEPRRVASINLYAVAGVMAAAACLAVIFIQRQPTTAPSPQSPVAVAAPAPDDTRTIAQTVTVPMHRTDFKPALRVAPALLAENPASSETLQDDRLDWLNKDFQFSKLPQAPVESLRFETRSTLKPGQHGYGPGSMQETREYVGFVFQR